MPAGSPARARRVRSAGPARPGRALLNTGDGTLTTITVPAPAATA